MTRFEAFDETVRGIRERTGEPPASVWMSEADREALVDEIEHLTGSHHPRPLSIVRVNDVRVGVVEVMPPLMRKTSETTNKDGTKNFVFHFNSVRG